MNKEEGDRRMIDREAKEAKEQMIVEKRLLIAVESAGKIFNEARVEWNGNPVQVFNADNADGNVAKAALARIIYDEMKRAGEKES